jgi:hypothetical protein
MNMAHMPSLWTEKSPKAVASPCTAWSEDECHTHAPKHALWIEDTYTQRTDLWNMAAMLAKKLRTGKTKTQAPWEEKEGRPYQDTLVPYQGHFCEVR